MFDGLKGAVPLFTHEKTAKPNLVTLVVYLVALGLLGGTPGMSGWEYATQGGQWGRKNLVDLIFDGFEGAVALFTHEKTVYPNLVISVLFSTALWLSRGPLQSQMGDASLQEGNTVGQIRKTYHLMI